MSTGTQAPEARTEPVMKKARAEDARKTDRWPTGDEPTTRGKELGAGQRVAVAVPV